MKYLSFLYCLFFFEVVFAQTISGTISDGNEVVPFADIILKNKNNIVSQFLKTDGKGFFKIILNKQKDFFFIEVTSHSYESIRVDLKDLVFVNNQIQLNLFLKKKVNILNEVVVKRENIIIKNDTTEYNINSFKDGSEKVVEDLLKKLPGIRIENNGGITFKGKAIKKLLLDGDDIFDSNYKIGSRNISVELIEKVQGIENYEENSLLKGLKDSDDVAINLILKKGKTDFSGEALLSAGSNQRFYGSATGIIVNKTLKSFGVTSYNNVGQNTSSYDFNDNHITLENQKNAALSSKSLISEGNFNSILDYSFHNLNSTFHSSINMQKKVFNKSNFKVNLGIYSDEIIRYNENNMTINTNGQVVETMESNFLTKKPIAFSSNLYFTNKEQSNFHWDYVGKFNINKISFLDSSINNGLFQNNIVNSRRISINQNLNNTIKFSESSAIVTTVQYSKSNNPQDFLTNPSTLIDAANNLASSFQQSEFEKQFFTANSTFYSYLKNWKYTLQGNYTNIRNTFNSVLMDINEKSLGLNFENSNTYNIQTFAINQGIVFNSKDFSFKVGLRASDNVLYFEDLTFNTMQHSFFLMPKFLLIYKFNSANSASFNYEYEQILPDEDRLFSGIVQTNYRRFISNQFTLEQLKVHSFNFNYNFSDLYNQSHFSLALSHNYRPNNYFNNTIINSNITVSNQFFMAIASQNYNIKISGEKYFHPLRTTFKFDSSFNLSLDNNIVNNSPLREINSQNFILNLNLKRGFKKWLVLESNFFYLNNSIKVSSIQTNNNFQMLNNQTKIILKSIKSVRSSIVSNFVAPNLKSNNNYYFLDLEISFSTENKKSTYSLIGKNLTNNKFFITRDVNDFSTSNSSHNLIHRYVMARYGFSF